MEGARQHKKAACIDMILFFEYLGRRTVRKNKATTRYDKFTVRVIFCGIETGLKMVGIDDVVGIKKSDPRPLMQQAGRQSRVAYCHSPSARQQALCGKHCFRHQSNPAESRPPPCSADTAQIDCKRSFDSAEGYPGFLCGTGLLWLPS